MALMLQTHDVFMFEAMVRAKRALTYVHARPFL